MSVRTQNRTRALAVGTRRPGGWFDTAGLCGTAHAR